MDNHFVDDELAAQLMMPPESPLCFQLVVMNNHSVDDELAARLIMPPEFNLILQNADKEAQSVDDAVAAQPLMPYGLGPSQNNSQSPTVRASLE
jgi:hypothetical protein